MCDVKCLYLKNHAIIKKLSPFFRPYCFTIYIQMIIKKIVKKGKTVKTSFFDFVK